MDSNFISITAKEGMEFFNGVQTAQKVTAPLGADLSEWVERVIVPPIEEDLDNIFIN